MSDLDLDIQIAEAEAEAAERERALSQSPPVSPSPIESPSSIGSVLSSALRGVGDSVINLPSRVGESLSSAYEGLSAVPSALINNKAGNPPLSLDELFLRLATPAVKRVEEQSVPQTISDITAETVGQVPFVGGPLAGAVEVAADASDEYRGLTPETSLDAKARKFGDIAGSSIMPELAIRGARFASRHTPRVVKDLGRNTEVMLTEQSGQRGVSAAVQDAPRGTTPAERQVAFDIEPHEKRFFESGLADDIDVSARNRSNAYNQYLDRINDLNTSAQQTKAGILAEADRAGATVGLDDIDTSSLSSIIDKDRASGFTSDTARASTAALRTLESDLGVNTAPHGAISTGDPSRRSISITQAQDYVRRLDDRIRELGAYDDSPLARASQNPSDLANIQAEAKSLRAVRESVNNALVAKVKETLGDEAAARLENANADVAMTIEYGNLGKRFRGQSLEGLTPGSDRAMTGPRAHGTLSSRIADWAGENLNPFYKSGAAMERGRTAVEKLQKLGEYVRGEKPPMYPREFPAAAATSLQALASSLPGLTQRSFPNAQMPVERPIPRSSAAVASNPDALIRRALVLSGGNQQLVQDIRAAIAEPNEQKRAMAFAELARSIPGLFQQSQWRSEWDGRLTDPMERSMYIDGARTQYSSGSLDANQLAQLISNMNRDGSLTNPTPPIADNTPAPVKFPRAGTPKAYAY